jgi:predicted transcriptional regulator
LNDLGIAVFDRWFSSASSEEAKVLFNIANAGTPLSAKEIQDSASAGHVKVSTGSISKYLQRLVEKKLIDKTGRGSYTVTDKMFRAYIRDRGERQ